METEGSPEPIDFNFFDEDDDKGSRYDKKSPSSRNRYDDDAATRSDKYRQDRPSSGRPDSVRSTASSRSSLSVKIPSANGTPRERKGSYSSDEEDDYSPKRVNGFDKHDKKGTKVLDKSSRSRSDSGGSSGPSKSTRPKTSKGPRDRNSSGSSSASNSSSLGSKSSKSDDYSSSSHSSDSESVTDVSPMQSPINSRSPSPTRLQYDDNEMDSSPERKGSTSRYKREAKDSVRFKEPPRSGHVRSPASKESTRLAATEAQELSALLRAVLEMEETPKRSNLHNFEGEFRSRPSSGKRPLSGKAMPHQRMNMSFSNDEVRRIDKDNQRLLQNIMSPPSSLPGAEKKRPKSGRMRTRSASYGSSARPSSAHVSHSALLRQKEQRRIEMENLVSSDRIMQGQVQKEHVSHLGFCKIGERGTFYLFIGWKCL